MEFVQWMIAVNPWIAAMAIFWLPWPAAFAVYWAADRTAHMIVRLVEVLWFGDSTRS